MRISEVHWKPALADLAVLDRDFMTAPLGEIAKIESLLTVVGGKVVYAAQPYSQLGQST
jgi:predicted amidohydrolase YtcJ